MPNRPKRTEQARLVDRLTSDPDMRRIALHVTPGDAVTSREELCREINRALDQVEAGAARPSTRFEGGQR